MPTFDGCAGTETRYLNPDYTLSRRQTLYTLEESGDDTRLYLALFLNFRSSPFFLNSILRFAQPFIHAYSAFVLAVMFMRTVAIVIWGGSILFLWGPKSALFYFVLFRFSHSLFLKGLIFGLCTFSRSLYY